MGSAVLRSAARRAAPVRTVEGPAAHCARHARGSVVSHPGRNDGRVLRAGQPTGGRDGRCRDGGRRGARLPVLRQPRPARVRRRHRKSRWTAGRRRDSDRRRGSRLRRRVLCACAEVRARHGRLECVVGHRAGAGVRPNQVGRHRIRRRRLAGELPHRAEQSRRRRRQRAQDRAAQHAVRRGGQGRVRHVLHRLLPQSRRHRTDAAQHVSRQSARQHRPHPGLLHRSHRWIVFLSHRRLSRRPTATAAITVRRLAGDRQFERKPSMNNLYRELAPITEAAWADIELEATRTFKRHIAGRRVVDVSGPGGPTMAAVGIGRLTDVTSPSEGVIAHLRASKPLVRLRVPFTLSRSEIDDVERGAKDSDWDPVKDAAKKLAFVEDRAIFEGYGAASIEGIRNASSNTPLKLPKDARAFPDVISQALSGLRLAGVDGPYSVLLSADAYTKVSETTEHGYPIREHLHRLVDGDIIWAPAIDGAFVLTTRGGDFDLQLGTDLAIGYLSHDADTVQLYMQETMTFLCYTAEASVCLGT